MKKRRKNVSSPNYIAKSLRSSKFSQKVIQSKKLYNRKGTQWLLQEQQDLT